MIIKNAINGKKWNGNTIWKREWKADYTMRDGSVKNEILGFYQRRADIGEYDWHILGGFMKNVAKVSISQTGRMLVDRNGTLVTITSR